MGTKRRSWEGVEWCHATGNRANMTVGTCLKCKLHPERELDGLPRAWERGAWALGERRWLQAYGEGGRPAQVTARTFPFSIESRTCKFKPCGNQAGPRMSGVTGYAGTRTHRLFLQSEEQRPLRSSTYRPSGMCAQGARPFQREA